MSLLNLISRGLGLIKAGKAIREIRASTDPEKKKRATHYLMEILGKGRGLPTKLGQFLALDGDQELKEKLDNSIPPMSFSEVADILEKSLQAPYRKIFHSLEKKGLPASLGQVHFGKLKNGKEVAVKVQYPGIGSSVNAELTLFGLMPKVGPVKKWGFSLEGYREAFFNNFNLELDYQREAENQQRYRELVSPLGNIIVPEIIRQYCRPNIIVQSRETGFSLEKAESMSKPEKQAMGRILLKHYIHMLFRHGWVHSDPNPANFAFRGPGEASLILYDFGSVLKIEDDVRLTLLRIILALQDREPLDPVECLAGLGFDPDKLEDLRSNLPALLQVLLDPFTTDGPYDLNDWRISERFDAQVGELKWWFRSAAPPGLIFLMRTLHGMIAMLRRLDAQLPWKFLLEQTCGDLFESARRLKFKPASKSDITIAGFDRLSRYLKIYVVKANGNKITLTMPARVVEDLEGVIDPPVLESIREQKIDLEKIKKRIERSGFTPQLVFELQDSERKIKVWLE